MTFTISRDQGRKPCTVCGRALGAPKLVRIETIVADDRYPISFHSRMGQEIIAAFQKTLGHGSFTCDQCSGRARLEAV